MGRFSIIFWLLVGAFVLRSLVPVGYMVAPGDTAGLIQVVICTGDVFETVWIDEDGNITEKDDQPTHSDLKACPYTALTLALDLQATDGLLNSPSHANAVRLSHDGVLLLETNPYYAARAPPFPA
ncbi:MAG: DUF2946 family protein [Pseudomonadota bacterium]